MNEDNDGMRGGSGWIRRNWPILGIVALTLVGVAVFAVPAWLRARRLDQLRLCCNNLNTIEGVIGHWALDNDQPPGAVPSIDEFAPYLDGPFPSCPSGFSYVIEKGGAYCPSGLEAHTNELDEGIPIEYFLKEEEAERKLAVEFAKEAATSCRENLRRIHSLKGRWRTENEAAWARHRASFVFDGVVSIGDLVPYLEGPFPKCPSCPGGCSYEIGVLGEVPTCPTGYEGHAIGAAETLTAPIEE